MIKFFRRIRQKLLSEGKTRKYFRYAIGEIVLVMIGILLALQVNNWNESRKAIKKEKLLLQEFKASIEKDLLGYDENYNWRLERKKSGLDSLLYYIKYKKQIHDTLFKEFYRKMNMDIRLRHDKGPYEALKSTGLDYIRNDSLRTEINRTYILLPAIQFWSHSYDAENNPKITELEYKIANIKTFDYNRNQFLAEYEIKLDNIIANQDFLRIYELQSQKYNIYIYRLEQMKTTLKELKTKIEEELNKL